MTHLTSVRLNGKLAHEFCNLTLPIQVLKSAAGFYIGTICNVEGPISRESVEYWTTKEKAESALQLGEWTQREHP